MILKSFLLCCTSVFAYGSDSTYNWSPSSRQIYPVAVYAINGTARNNGPVFGYNDTNNGYTLDAGSAITYDFGQMTAGFLSVNIGLSTNSTLNIAYTESADFIGFNSDEGVLYGQNDGPLPIRALPFTTTTVTAQYGRGSFRFVTLTATDPVQILGISNHFSALPGVTDDSLRNYTGYFHSSDDLLNRIWYAGAYTNQLCLIAANSSVDHLTWIINGGGWSNNATVQPLKSTDVFLADGAKRDRNPWAGDLSVAVASIAVSQNRDNLVSVRNAIAGMLVLQNNDTGYFPYAGSPLGSLLNPLSDTYHMWTMAGFADYVTRSGDVAFGLTHLSAVIKGLEAVRVQIENTTGLFNGSGSNDWGRVGLTGAATATNAILYHTLQSFISLAPALNSSILNDSYVAQLQRSAATIKTSANVHLFDAETGMYVDNTTTAGRSLYPQDGNSYALRYNLTTDSAQAQRVSANLAARLGPFGAPAPELPSAISPYISGHEIEAHFAANPSNASNALNLIRRQWGYMQKFSASTQIEGYSTDGSLKYAFYPTSSFISHAHAWSTGPTASLISHVLGLSQATATVAWVFAPQYIGSQLTFASGGFRAGNASYEAHWQLTANGTFTARLNVTSASRGTIRLPSQSVRQILINGVAQRGQLTTNNQLEFVDLAAGNYTITY